MGFPAGAALLLVEVEPEVIEILLKDRERQLDTSLESIDAGLDKWRPTLSRRDELTWVDVGVSAFAGAMV